MLETNEDKDKFLREWVTALESDKYQQGKILLCSEGKYCCLGVACELAGLPHTILDNSRNYFGDYGCITKENPLFSIFDWFGKLPKPLHYHNSVSSSLSRLNDNGMNFKDIAKVIRKYYLGEDVSLPEGLTECDTL